MNLSTGVLTTADIRKILVASYQDNPFQPMVEIKGASFWADWPSIIGAPNPDYIAAELEWYKSQSLDINDIGASHPGAGNGNPPALWRRTANTSGEINSNYGWVLWSDENGNQFKAITDELRRDYASRRAVCIYTRPSMHVDQKLGGSGQDFMCTNAVHYSVNPSARTLDVVVQMRSNDVVFGYRNDYAWQVHAAEAILEDLRRDWRDLELGIIMWQAASLHVYPRHYALLREAAESGTKGRVEDGAL